MPAPYEPLAPYLANRTILTQDHIAHIDRGITGAEKYAEEVAAAVQAGQLSTEVLDEAIDRAVTDGRIPTGEVSTEPVSITQVQPGVYEITGLAVTHVGDGVYQIGA